jgi:two-component system, response regulator FlrC
VHAAPFFPPHHSPSSRIGIRRDPAGSRVPEMADAATESVPPRPFVLDDAVRELVGRTLAEVERRLIIGTLDRCSGNRTHAARVLGISIRTLRNKLHDYGEAGFSVPEAGWHR